MRQKPQAPAKHFARCAPRTDTAHLATAAAPLKKAQLSNATKTPSPCKTLREVRPAHRHCPPRNSSCATQESPTFQCDKNPKPLQNTSRGAPRAPTLPTSQQQLRHSRKPNFPMRQKPQAPAKHFARCAPRTDTAHLATAAAPLKKAQLSNATKTPSPCKTLREVRPAHRHCPPRNSS